MGGDIEHYIMSSAAYSQNRGFMKREIHKIALPIFLVCLLFSTPAQSQITEMDSPTESVDFSDVWGTSAHDVFAVGTDGTIVHYDGDQWTLMDTPTQHNLTSVWGTKSNNIYVVGDAGTILHYDGTAWSEMESGTEENLNDIWGFSSDDVYVVGNNVNLLRYNGIGWSPMEIHTDLVLGNLYAVWGPSADSLYVVCYEEVEGWGVLEYVNVIYYDGTEWKPSYKHNQESYGGSLWGWSKEVFCTILFGWGTTFIHSNGSEWNRMLMEHPWGIITNYNKVHGTSSSDIYVVGNVTSDATPAPPGYPDPQLYWNLVCHYDGTEWTWLDYKSEDYYSFEGIWCSSPSEIFIVGSNDTIVFHDGAPVTTTTTTRPVITTTSSTTSSTTSAPATTSTTTTTVPVQPCIIETIFGESSKETDMARSFRNRVLNKSNTGKKLIDIYYRLNKSFLDNY